MKKAFSVTELNGQIKHLLEESFDLFWVEGEISNLHRPASGHIYFTLKDEKSQIRAVIFRSTAGNGPFARAGRLFELENGMSIVCRARLTVYQPRGEYQLLVDSMEPLGIGSLQKAFEQLKERLHAEGLFDPRHKQKLPLLPRRIGVITSPSGAVIKDILHITRRRFPNVGILIAPARVQGPEAPDEIIQAIHDLHVAGGIEVIILARGGGSLEDLAPFNNERVARAIFKARIPIIAAIGHETDYTIADFVADLRAPTPSAAAEIAVPVKMELAATIEALRFRLVNQQNRRLERCREKMLYNMERLPSPGRLIGDLRLHVGAALDRMQSYINQRMLLQRQQAGATVLRLRHFSPLFSIRNIRGSVEILRKDIMKAGAALREVKRMHLAAGLVRLDALSPLAVLARGYSVTRLLPQGMVLRNANLLRTGANVDVTLAVGGFQAQVTQIYGSEEGWPRKNSKMP